VKVLSILAILLLGLTAGASGSRVGNGGHGVVCKDSSGHEYLPELLDLYEAVHAYGRVAQWIGANSLDEALEVYKRKIALALPENHPFLRVLDQIDNLKLDFELVDNLRIQTDDLGLFAKIDPNCRVVQLAIRGEDILNCRLQISKEFWNGTGYDTQALLLIHEAFHSWFDSSSSVASGTLAIRQAVGLLYTSAMVDSSDRQLFRSLVENRAPVLF